MSISSPLRELLVAAKSETPPSTWEEVAAILAPLYFPDMTFVDTLSLLIGAYEQALFEPRLCIRGGNSAAVDLLLSPVKGHFSVERWGPQNLATKYSIEDFYNAMVKSIISDLRLTRSDWCRAELFPEQPKEECHA